MLKNGKCCSSFQHRKKMDLLNYDSECLTTEKEKENPKLFLKRVFAHRRMNDVMTS